MRWLAVLALLGCSSKHADPRCDTQPMFITTHPHAPAQPTDIGQSLADTRGWHGRVYFGYGDLGANTGPIMISSLDPATSTWTDHLLFQTERIVRFDPIADVLYAPAGQAKGNPPSDYAVGTATHDWTAAHISASLHLIEAVERVPGDVYLTGEDWFDMTQGITSASVYRSQNGGPFTQIFPTADGNNNLNTWFFNAAALGGILYPGFGWTFDGTTWAHPAVDLGEYQRPTTFANRIVSATLSELWAFDGTRMTNLHVSLFPTPCQEQTTITPLPLFEQTEGRLLAIDDQDRVQVTTNLETWTCIGQAPPDACSIGSLDGTIYFGGPAGRVYAFPAPSW
jgi:hypothetical protein